MDEMSAEEKQIRATEAGALLSNEAAMSVMAEFRAAQLEQLGTIDPQATEEIIRLQATVSVIDNFRDTLEAFVLEAQSVSRKEQTVV